MREEQEPDCSKTGLSSPASHSPAAVTIIPRSRGHGRTHSSLKKHQLYPELK